MAKNIYVGNLSFETTAAELETAFSQFGTVQRAQITTDRETGRSRGFGFVEMSQGGDEAKPREPRTGGGGGGGGYGGGNRGGYGGGSRRY